MRQSITVLTEKRKKRGPAPTGKGTLVGVRLQPDLLDAVDAYAISDDLEKDGEPQRPEAIRRLIIQALALRKSGRKFVIRDADTMRRLHRDEEAIREGEFWRSKPEDIEAAVKRLWRTGAFDTGGADWPADAPDAEIKARLAEELDQCIRFDLMWSADPGLARQIDWRRS
ncbi:MAG: hypothetical protein M9955_20155 [Rhizobiaceae bacterium]|nr:hypothetical protein [Rhizobiaceae bacterium]